MTTLQEELREVLMDATTHFERVCLSCGNTWLGLHCPHDGYQNPCPGCKSKPQQIEGEDRCVGVTDIDQAVDAIIAALQARLPKKLDRSPQLLPNGKDVANYQYAAGWNAYAAAVNEVLGGTE